MEFSRQENWSGLPFPTPEVLPDPVIEPCTGRQILCYCATGKAPKYKRKCFNSQQFIAYYKYFNKIILQQQQIMGYKNKCILNEST